MSAEILILAFFVFMFAGVIKGTIGIGLPTIAISTLAQFVDPRVAIALLLLPALFTNSWQIYRGGRVMHCVQNLWPFGLTLMCDLFIATFFAPRIPVDYLVGAIGVMVVLWALSSLVKPPAAVPDHLDKSVQVIAGLVAGISGGLTAIWSPPMVMYLQSRGLAKNDFVAFTGFLILCGTVPLTIGYLLNGLLTRELALGSALMILPTLAGFSIGERLRERLNGQQFQRFVLVVFCVMGLNLIRRALL